MSHSHDPLPDEDLTPRFQWRWGEHGIYLGVCGIIGLLVLALHVVPTPPMRRCGPELVEVIQVRYLTAADEPPEKEDPFHDPRLIRPPRQHGPGEQLRRAM
jgi:hypothetical protein